MGKVSPISIKYMIYATFEAAGALEKPDVIGALFGQTEGLLGAELELRELQKEGKIGRIDVDLKNEGGKTTGEIRIPTSLGKPETALIAAAIETILRIGPTDAKIEVKKIEDIRGEKRGFIVERAKKLLAGIEGESETREMADTLKEQSRLAELQEYGLEKLPAGDISGREMIIVEGRADVVNLLKNGIKNAIGMDGTKLPETIKELSYEKETTLFIDGDRGGRLIAKNVCDNARIDSIASAPDGKEVEELTGKEILIALRRKVRVHEFFRSQFQREKERRYGFEPKRELEREKFYERKELRQEKMPEQPSEEAETEKRKKFEKMMKEIAGTKNAYLLDENLEIIKKASSASIGASLMRSRKNVYAIVMDKIVTKPIVKKAEEKGVKVIAARNFAFTETGIKLLSL